ncbi:hypothetical protein ACFW04_013821 [Cataglyphis niger]
MIYNISNYIIFKTVCVTRYNLNFVIIFSQIKYNAVQKQIKRRPKKIKFAVGIIVTHRDYSSNAKIIHNGVIIGWHPTCNKKFLHRLRKSNMFPYLCLYKQCHVCICHQFADSTQEPHYVILTEINKICYIEQNQLSICAPKEIENVEIGKCFSKFVGTHYVPNKSLIERYPNDTAAIEKILTKQ